MFRVSLAAACLPPTRTGSPSAAARPRACDAALARYPKIADRSVATGGRGEGGDRTLVIDTAAEDAIFLELESIGIGLTAVSEERGHVPIAGGGPGPRGHRPDRRLAQREAPDAAVRGLDRRRRRRHDGRRHLRVREGPRARARSGGPSAGDGAFLDGAQLPQLPEDAELELLALEMIRPQHVLSTAEALAATGAARLRAIGSVALSLCFVAAGRFDALVTLVDLPVGRLPRPAS